MMDWNRVVRSVRAMKKRKEVPAGSLAYVFAQLSLLGIGKKATGYEYVPNRRRLSSAERDRARAVLKKQLEDSLALLTAESSRNVDSTTLP